MKWAGVALIGLASIAAYFPALHGGFLLDDDQLLTRNVMVHAPDGLYRFWFTDEPQDYWPVTSTTFWMEWRLWEMNSLGYHCTNLILHIVESLLVWSILKRLNIPGAFLAGLLFAVHPVNVESVAWIAQRKNVMAMLFFLLSILWYVKSEDALADRPPRSAGIQPTFWTRLVEEVNNRWYWLSLLAFVLSMLSKGSVAILPLLLLLIVWWRRPLTRWDLVRVLPFFLVSGALTLVNIWFQTHGEKLDLRHITPIGRLLGAGAVVWFYLYKAILPIHLLFFYPQWKIDEYDVRWWLPLVATIGVSLLLWRQRNTRWGKPLFFAGAFFCISLVPVMGFTDVGYMRYSLVADHYQHIAMIAVVALIAAGLAVWNRNLQVSARWISTAAAGAVALLLAALTLAQSSLYRDVESLYTLSSPNSWIAQNCLAGISLSRGELEPAIKHFEEALRLNPDYPEAEIGFGLALVNAGQPETAIPHLRHGVELKPDSPEAHNNLGIALKKAGQTDEAIRQYKLALQLNPNYAEAYNNLGTSLEQSGKTQDAFLNYRHALQLKPFYAEAHNNLGSLLLTTGKIDEAQAQFEEAVRANPNLAEAQRNFALALLMKDHVEEAVPHLQRALHSMPADVDLWIKLGIAFTKLGRSSEAIEPFRQVARLKPDNFDAANNLGTALLNAGDFAEAIVWYQRALQIDGENAHTWANLALAYEQSNQTTDTINAFRKARALAKLKNDPALVDQIEKWMAAHRVTPGSSSSNSLEEK